MGFELFVSNVHVVPLGKTQSCYIKCIKKYTMIKNDQLAHVLRVPPVLVLTKL